MLKNPTYNLMEMAAVISKGLHRYATFYQDAKDCQACQQIWNYMKQTDEEHLQRIMEHMKQHFDREMGSSIVAA